MATAAGRAARRAPVRVVVTGRPCGMWSRRGAFLIPGWTSRPVGGVPQGAQRPKARDRARGCFRRGAEPKAPSDPGLKPGRPPTVYRNGRKQAGYSSSEEQSVRPVGGKLSGDLKSGCLRGPLTPPEPGWLLAPWRSLGPQATPVCGASNPGTLPTRLETRTKESNMCASHWDKD